MFGMIKLNPCFWQANVICGAVGLALFALLSDGLPFWTAATIGYVVYAGLAVLQFNRCIASQAARAEPAPAPAARPAAPQPLAALPKSPTPAPALPRAPEPAPALPKQAKPVMLAAARGGASDDLKRIKGIGKKLEKMLHDMGVHHFDQIAAWTEAELAWVDDNLEGFKGRASRDAWVPQAKILAAGGTTEFAQRVDAGDVPSSQA